MPTATDNRHAEALRLRREGLSYSRIATELGYGPYPSAARYAVMAGLRAEGVSQSTTSRKFGVEIEFFNVSVHQVLNALSNAGIQCSFEGYTHRIMDTWKLVTDGSVTSRGTGTGSGLELVSPILSGTDGLSQVVKVLDAIESAGARVNTSCGLHVHIDTNDMSHEERASLFLLYTRNQDILDRFVSRSRRHNQHYTMRYSASSIDTIKERIRNGYYSFSRYHTVNISSMDKYGTFEFRQHQGTVNSKKVANWVKLLLAMSTKAMTIADADTVEAKTNSLDFFSYIGLEGEVARFFQRREAQLNRQAIAA